MTTENCAYQNGPTSTASDHSSKWSISTSNLGKETTMDSPISITNYDTKSQSSLQSGCVPFVKIFRSVFHHHRRKQSKLENVVESVDDTEYYSFQRYIFTKILENISLLDTFIEASLIPKIKLHLKETSFPPYSLSKVAEASLPTAQVWTATYLLKLVRDSHQSKNKEMDFAPYRKLLMSLCWDMEMTKKVGLEFYSKYTEFSALINRSMKELRGVFQNYSSPSILKIRDQLELNKQLDLNTKASLTKEKPTVALQIKSSFYLNLPISFTLDSSKIQEHQLALATSDFSSLDAWTQRNIIVDLLKSATRSLERGYRVMKSCTDRILSRGVIIKGPVASKDVNCYNTISSVRHLLAKLIFKRKRGLKLKESDEHELIDAVTNIFQKWNEYTQCAQTFLQMFFEMCDMTRICYNFAVNHLQMNIPTLNILQKEVNIAIVAYNKQLLLSASKSPSAYLKYYALTTLIEECNDNPTQGCKQDGDFFFKLINSTRYHLLLQQYPLDVWGRNERNVIVLRYQPDLERKASEMILNFDSTIQEIPVNKGDYSNVISWNIFENVHLDSFKGN